MMQATRWPTNEANHGFAISSLCSSHKQEDEKSQE